MILSCQSAGTSALIGVPRWGSMSTILPPSAFS
jgi:hypothetical protein